MRPICLLILLTYLIQSCDQIDNQVSTDELNLTIEWGGINWKIPSDSNTIECNQNSLLDTSRIYHIVATIFNPTADTIAFRSMTCSYEDMFCISDSTNFTIQSRMDCYSNAPFTIKLPPNKRTKRFIMIRQLTSFRDWPSEPFKLGMHHESKIIWSNELETTELGTGVIY